MVLFQYIVSLFDGRGGETSAISVSLIEDMLASSPDPADDSPGGGGCDGYLVGLL